MNFELVKQFSGNNPEFEKQLVTAFLSEIENFRLLIDPLSSAETFLEFRKAHHSINPSLQMLGLNILNQHIEAYKVAFNDRTAEKEALAAQLDTMINEVINETKQWLLNQ